MPSKTHYSGAIISGTDRGAPVLSNQGQAVASVLTTVQSSPVTGLIAAVLPPGGQLIAINVLHRATIVGEALLRFGTASDGSDNLGSVSLSAAGRYSAFIDSASAMTTTLPMGMAPVSGETTIYVSTGATSGSLVSLQGNVFVDVVFTVPDLVNLSRTIPHETRQVTHFTGPIKAGKDLGYNDGFKDYAFATFVQRTTVGSAPVTAQLVGVLPHGARLQGISFYVGAAIAGEAQARAEIGSATGASNLGAVTLSGAGKYSVGAAASLTALTYGFNNAGSAQPIFASLVAASGTISAASAKVVCEISYTRFDESKGFVGQTNALVRGTGLTNGFFLGPRPGKTQGKASGMGRFVQTTTVANSPTTGVSSSQQVGVLPRGWALLDARLFNRNTLATAAECRVRFTTREIFTASDLASITVSGIGEYSLNTATAGNEIPGLVNTASALPLFVSILALSGSITSLTANPMVVQLTMARANPEDTGG
jgi:hypothetical protein